MKKIYIIITLIFLLTMSSCTTVKTGIENPFISDTNVSEFENLSNGTIKDVENITPLWIIEKYNINVFEKKDNSDVYIMYDNEIISLYPWSSPGSGGVHNICVEDINKDGMVEIYLSINYSKRNIYGRIYGFDTKTKSLIKSTTNYEKVDYFVYKNDILYASDFLSITKSEYEFEFAKLEYNVKNDMFEVSIKIDPYNINFPATFKGTNEFLNKQVIMEVKTKYIGPTYEYMGSSTTYGAITSFENEEEIYGPCLAFNDDYGRVIIEEGQEFNNTYNIDYLLNPKVGKYDLIVSYNGSQIILEDALEITKI